MADSDDTRPAPPAAQPRRLSKSLAALEGTGYDSAPVSTTPAPSPTDPVEVGGPEGPDPTRYGDWERKGRCIDF